MARVKEGLTSIKGYINGISFYSMEGKDYAKRSSAPDPVRLATDPVYTKVRTNFNLFGVVSNIVKPLRITLHASFGNAMKNRINGALVSLFRSMVMAAPDNYLLNLRQHAKALQAFSFHEERIFDQTAAFLPFELICAPDRSSVRLQIKPFQHSRKKGESGRTHFRMTVAVQPFADHTARVSGESIVFKPAKNDWHTRLIMADSGYCPIGGLKKAHVITLEIPPAAATKKTSLLVLLHLSFYEEVNGTMYLMSSESVLKIADVM